MKKWKIKVNETKSVHMTFTLKKGKCPPIRINIIIHQKEQAKYLGHTLDSKLIWKPHLLTKRKQLELKLKELYWLLGKKSFLTIDNKLLIYKTVLKQIWTYGIQLWGCSSKTNRKLIQTTQSKILRTIVNAPW
jgi:hypothetical protein